MVQPAQLTRVSVAEGREVVEKELQRQGMTSVNLEKLAQSFGFDKTRGLLRRSRPRRNQVSASCRSPLRGRTTRRQSRRRAAAARAKSRARSRGGILIVGVDKLLTVPARCCKPAPPDAIVGFVSRGRGVTHPSPRLRERRASRGRAADRRGLGRTADATFPVDVVIEAVDRTGLLRDITEIFSREGVNVTATNTREPRCLRAHAPDGRDRQPSPN